MNGDAVTGFDVRRIMDLIPHRFPMLLVDRVESHEPDVALTAVKGVTMNEPFFAGHFPGRPIMPGVLIVEALAQTAAIHAMLSMGQDAADKLVYFMSIDGAKFRHPVEPGCLLRLHVTQQQVRSRVRRYHGVATVEGRAMAEAEFTAMIADRPAA